MEYFSLFFQKKAANPVSKQNGVVEHQQSNSKESGGSSPAENKDKESKEVKEVKIKESSSKEAQCNHSPEDSDEHTESADKKRKANKQKWVPLEIDIAKNRNKRERSPRHFSHREKYDNKYIGKRSFRTLLKRFV